MATKHEKTECPLTKAEFKKDAEALTLKIGDKTMTATVKEFSTGSFGWYLNEKVTVMVGKVPVQVQVGGNLIVVGSKEAK